MNLLDIIKKFNSINNTIYIIDFDHTITTFDSNTSIGVYSLYLGQKYKKKKDKIDSLSSRFNGKTITKLFWILKIKLLNRYYNSNLKKMIARNFKIRKDFKWLIKYFNINNIDYIICSSGHRDLIDYILKDNGISNYKLLANEINTRFYKIITPYNKYKFIKKHIKGRKTVIIGDHIGDSYMVKDCYVSIGIANASNKSQLEKYFDYVIIGDDCCEK